MNSDTILAAVVGFIFALFLQVVISYLNRQEARRKERQDYLRVVIKSLAETRGEIQWGQVSFYKTFTLENSKHEHIEIELTTERRTDAFEKLQLALGRAHAILVSTGNKQLFTIGMHIMEISNSQPDAQNALIRDALAQLGQMAGMVESL